MLIQVEEPADEPVTLDEARQQCSIDGTERDGLLTLWIAAARGMVEAFTRLRLVTQTVELRRTGFGGCLALPVAPVQSIVGITYLDSAGVEQIVAPGGYRLLRTSAMPQVVATIGATWPVTLIEPDTVGIRAVVGFGPPAAVPAVFRAAILMLVSHWNENREAAGEAMAEMPFSVRDVLYPHIFWI